MGAELVGGMIELVDRLTRWGYLRSGVALADAIRWYQENHAPALDELATVYHGRYAVRARSAADLDGDIGPATAQVMNSRYCDTPDILPGSAIEEANWPTSCRQEITVSWNFKAAPGLTEAETTAVWQAVKEEYERLFDLTMILRGADGYGTSRINAQLLALPGSTLAWSYLANNNCGARLQQSYDTTIRWSMGLAIGTWKHEIGHALGMNHTPNDRNSLMYPSMNGQSGLNQTDIAQMQRLGYARRTKPPDPDWGPF